MRFLALLLASCIGAGAMAAPPPKQAVDDRADPNAKIPEVGKGTRMGSQPLKPGAYLNEQARKSVREYYAGRKDCPPGLASKKNGCMPPGQAKKWRIGHAVPKGGRIAPVPQEVLVLLPKAPPGHQYIAYSGDILLIAATSRMVVDAITINVTVR
jgi:Ni/Co efflux regulator RcnB